MTTTVKQFMLKHEIKKKWFNSWLMRRSLEVVPRLADDYALTRKVSFLNKSNPSGRQFFPQSGSKPSPSNPFSGIAEILLLNQSFLAKTGIKIPYIY